MATTLATPSNSLVKMRWEEPYVSDGLNAKLNGIVPAGVVRGGRLATGGVAFNLTIVADPESGDSVYSYINAQGRQITFRQIGDVTLDLTAVASTTVFIGLEVLYVISSATAVAWKAYSQAEIDADPTIVVLGKVVVPAGGPIPAANVTPAERREAWEKVSPATREWRQFAQNGSFDVAKAGALPVYGSDDDTLPGWDTNTGIVATGVSWSIAQTAARTGLNELRLTLTGAATQVAQLYQAGHGRVRSGDLIKVSVWIRSSVVAPGPGAGGHLGLLVAFYSENYGFVSSVEVDDLTIIGTTGYTEVSRIIEAPANAAFVEVAINFDDDAQSSTGSYYFDDFRVWIQKGWADDEDVDANEAFLSDLKGYSLDIVEQPPIASISNFINRMFRVRSDGVSSGVHRLLASCRDATTPHRLEMLHGGLKLDRLIENLGADLIGTAANASLARVEAPFPLDATAEYTLVLDLSNASAAYNVRVYVAEQGRGSKPQLVITTNAYWDGSQWVRDSAGVSMRYQFDAGSFSVFTRLSSGASPWSDADWDDGGTDSETLWTLGQFFGDSQYAVGNIADGFLAWSPAGAVANPAANWAFLQANALHAKNVVKSWGYFTVVGGVPTLVEGHNVASLSVTVGGLLDVNFQVVMASGDYATVVTPYLGLYTDDWTVVNKSANKVGLAYVDRSTGAGIDLNLNNAYGFFIVCAVQ